MSINAVFPLSLCSNNIGVGEKAEFGLMCRSELGRIWFARHVNEQVA